MYAFPRYFLELNFSLYVFQVLIRYFWSSIEIQSHLKYFLIAKEKFREWTTKFQDQSCKIKYFTASTFQFPVRKNDGKK